MEGAFDLCASATTGNRSSRESFGDHAPAQCALFRVLLKPITFRYPQWLKPCPSPRRQRPSAHSPQCLIRASLSMLKNEEEDAGTGLPVNIGHRLLARLFLYGLPNSADRSWGPERQYCFAGCG